MTQVHHQMLIVAKPAFRHQIYEFISIVYAISPKWKQGVGIYFPTCEIIYPIYYVYMNEK